MISQAGKPTCGFSGVPVGQSRAGVGIRNLFIVLVLVTLWGTGCAPPRVVRVKISPEDVIQANNAVREGDIAFARRDTYAALIKYLEAVRRNPNSEYIYNKLGIAYSQLKFYSEASSAFQRCILLNPKFAYAYNNLGSISFAMTDLKKAERHFKKALNLNPKSGSFHVNLGSVYLERKQFDKAMDEWRKALELDPNVMNKSESVNLGATGRSPAERYYFLARLHASQGNVSQAIENLQLALNAGFTDVPLIETEKDFDRIRSDEKFVAFMKTALLLTAPQKPH
jgi:tetratricopeptide (TPR) repeat protein